MAGHAAFERGFGIGGRAMTGRIDVETRNVVHHATTPRISTTIVTRNPRAKQAGGEMGKEQQPPRRGRGTPIRTITAA
jgi:hypothetical protein